MICKLTQQLDEKLPQLQSELELFLLCLPEDLGDFVQRFIENAKEQIQQ